VIIITDIDKQDDLVKRLGKAIGFSGALTDIIKVKNKIKEKTFVEDFLNEVLEVMKTIKMEELERSILIESIWTNRKEFVDNLQIIPKELKDFLFAKNAEYRLQLNCLVAGFDKNTKAKIFSINNEYEINDITDLCYYSIGSGTPFSVIFFDQENYNEKISLQEGLYFAYRAKKSAESHIGVGSQTDIIILRKEKAPVIIYADDERMKTFENLYEEEKSKNLLIREEIIKKMNLKGVA